MISKRGGVSLPLIMPFLWWMGCVTLPVSYAFVYPNVDADSNATMEHGNIERNEDQKLMNGDDKVLYSEEIKAINIGEAKSHDVGEFAQSAYSQVISLNSSNQTVVNEAMMDLLPLADKAVSKAYDTPYKIVTKGDDTPDKIVTKGDDIPDKTVTKGDDTPDKTVTNGDDIADKSVTKGDKASISTGDGMAPSSNAGGHREVNEIPAAVPESSSVLDKMMGFTSSFLQKPMGVMVKPHGYCRGEGCRTDKSTNEESTDKDSFKESTGKAANEGIITGTKNEAAGCCTDRQTTNMDRKATTSDDNDAVRTMIGSINGVNADAVEGDDADAVHLPAIGGDNVAAKNVASGVGHSNPDAHAGAHGEHDTGSCDHDGTCGTGGSDTTTSAAVAVKDERSSTQKKQRESVQTGNLDYEDYDNIPEFDELLLKFRQIKSEEQRQKTVNPDDGSELIDSALYYLVIAGYDLRIREAILHREFNAKPGPHVQFYVLCIVVFACCYCLFISMAFGKCVTYWEMCQDDRVAQCLIKGVTLPRCLCMKEKGFTCYNCTAKSFACCAAEGIKEWSHCVNPHVTVGLEPCRLWGLQHNNIMCARSAEFFEAVASFFCRFHFIPCCRCAMCWVSIASIYEEKVERRTKVHGSNSIMGQQVHGKTVIDSEKPNNIIFGLKDMATSILCEHTFGPSLRMSFGLVAASLGALRLLIPLFHFFWHQHPVCQRLASRWSPCPEGRGLSPEKLRSNFKETFENDLRDLTEYSVYVEEISGFYYLEKSVLTIREPFDYTLAKIGVDISLQYGGAFIVFEKYARDSVGRIKSFLAGVELFKLLQVLESYLYDGWDSGVSKRFSQLDRVDAMYDYDKARENLRRRYHDFVRAVRWVWTLTSDDQLGTKNHPNPSNERVTIKREADHFWTRFQAGLSLSEDMITEDKLAIMKIPRFLRTSLLRKANRLRRIRKNTKTQEKELEEHGGLAGHFGPPAGDSMIEQSQPAGDKNLGAMLSDFATQQSVGDQLGRETLTTSSRSLQIPPVAANHGSAMMQLHPIHNAVGMKDPQGENGSVELENVMESVEGEKGSGARITSIFGDFYTSPYMWSPAYIVCNFTCMVPLIIESFWTLLEKWFTHTSEPIDGIADTVSQDESEERLDTNEQKVHEISIFIVEAFVKAGCPTKQGGGSGSIRSSPILSDDDPKGKINDPAKLLDELLALASDEDQSDARERQQECDKEGYMRTIVDALDKIKDWDRWEKTYSFPISVLVGAFVSTLWELLLPKSPIQTRYHLESDPDLALYPSIKATGNGDGHEDSGNTQTRKDLVAKWNSSGAQESLNKQSAAGIQAKIDWLPWYGQCMHDIMHEIVDGVLTVIFGFFAIGFDLDRNVLDAVAVRAMSNSVSDVEISASDDRKNSVAGMVMSMERRRNKPGERAKKSQAKEEDFPSKMLNDFVGYAAAKRAMGITIPKVDERYYKVVEAVNAAEIDAPGSSEIGDRHKTEKQPTDETGSSASSRDSSEELDQKLRKDSLSILQDIVATIAKRIVNAYEASEKKVDEGPSEDMASSGETNLSRRETLKSKQLKQNCNTQSNSGQAASSPCQKKDLNAAYREDYETYFAETLKEMLTSLSNELRLGRRSKAHPKEVSERVKSPGGTDSGESKEVCQDKPLRLDDNDEARSEAMWDTARKLLAGMRMDGVFLGFFSWRWLLRALEISTWLETKWHFAEIFSLRKKKSLDDKGSQTLVSWIVSHVVGYERYMYVALSKFSDWCIDHPFDLIFVEVGGIISMGLFALGVLDRICSVPCIPIPYICCCSNAECFDDRDNVCKGSCAMFSVMDCMMTRVTPFQHGPSCNPGNAVVTSYTAGNGIYKFGDVFGVMLLVVSFNSLNLDWVRKHKQKYPFGHFFSCELSRHLRKFLSDLGVLEQLQTDYLTESLQRRLGIDVGSQLVAGEEIPDEIIISFLTKIFPIRTYDQFLYFAMSPANIRSSSPGESPAVVSTLPTAGAKSITSVGSVALQITNQISTAFDRSATATFVKPVIGDVVVVPVATVRLAKIVVSEVKDFPRRYLLRKRKLDVQDEDWGHYQQEEDPVFLSCKSDLRVRRAKYIVNSGPHDKKDVEAGNEEIAKIQSQANGFDGMRDLLHSQVGIQSLTNGFCTNSGGQTLGNCLESVYYLTLSLVEYYQQLDNRDVSPFLVDLDWLLMKVRKLVKKLVDDVVKAAEDAGIKLDTADNKSSNLEKLGPSSSAKKSSPPLSVFQVTESPKSVRSSGLKVKKSPNLQGFLQVTNSVIAAQAHGSTDIANQSEGSEFLQVKSEGSEFPQVKSEGSGFLQEEKDPKSREESAPPGFPCAAPFRDLQSLVGRLLGTINIGYTNTQYTTFTTNQKQPYKGSEEWKTYVHLYKKLKKFAVMVEAHRKDKKREQWFGDFSSPEVQKFASRLGSAGQGTGPFGIFTSAKALQVLHVDDGFDVLDPTMPTPLLVPASGTVGLGVGLALSNFFGTLIAGFNTAWVTQPEFGVAPPGNDSEQFPPGDELTWKSSDPSQKLKKRSSEEGNGQEEESKHTGGRIAKLVESRKIHFDEMRNAILGEGQFNTNGEANSDDGSDAEVDPLSRSVRKMIGRTNGKAVAEYRAADAASDARSMFYHGKEEGFDGIGSWFYKKVNMFYSPVSWSRSWLIQNVGKIEVPTTPESYNSNEEGIAKSNGNQDTASPNGKVNNPLPAGTIINVRYRERPTVLGSQPQEKALMDAKEREIFEQYKMKDEGDQLTRRRFQERIETAEFDEDGLSRAKVGQLECLRQALCTIYVAMASYGWECIMPGNIEQVSQGLRARKEYRKAMKNYKKLQEDSNETFLAGSLRRWIWKPLHDFIDNYKRDELDNDCDDDDEDQVLNQRSYRIEGGMKSEDDFEAQPLTQSILQSSTGSIAQQSHSSLKSESPTESTSHQAFLQSESPAGSSIHNTVGNSLHNTFEDASTFTSNDRALAESGQAVLEVDDKQHHDLDDHAQRDDHASDDAEKKEASSYPHELVHV